MRRPARAPRNKSEIERLFGRANDRTVDALFVVKDPGASVYLLPVRSYSINAIVAFAFMEKCACHRIPFFAH